MEDIPSLFPAEFSFCIEQAGRSAVKLADNIIDAQETGQDIDDDLQYSVCVEYARLTREFCPNIGDDMCKTVFSETLYRVFTRHGLLAP